MARGSAEALNRKAASAQAKAEAKAVVAQIQATVRDDVLNAETRSAVTQMGLGASPTKASNDADKYVPLYHAYDGRVVSIPMYMVEKRLTDRFEEDDLTVDPEFRGEQVWFHTPQEVAFVDRSFFCRLSADGTEEMKAEMKTAGLAAVCRKPAKFSTQFEADEHFRIKHRRRWEAWQRYVTGNQSTQSANSVSDVIKALAREIADLKQPAT